MMEAAAMELEHQMYSNDRILVATADLTTSCKLEHIQERFPDRFLDFGIAEQNMVTVAAGLAHEGWLPFVFTFGVFASLRASEQVRTDVCYNNVPVVVVGTHSGVSTGPAGPTHYAIEDIAVIRSFANSTVIVPCDATTVRWAIRTLVAQPRPCYVRLDRNPLPQIHAPEARLKMGKGVRLREGSDIAIIACGSCVTDAVSAAEQLSRNHGVSAAVWDMHTVKPVDTSLIISLALEHDLIVTVEEHSCIGGLGSAVAETVASNGGCGVMRIGIGDQFPRGGPVASVRRRLGINADGIVTSVVGRLKRC
jgi:transketolase